MKLRHALRGVAAVIAVASLTLMLAAGLGCGQKASSPESGAETTMAEAEEAVAETAQAEVAVEETDAAPEAREVYIQFCSS